MIDNSIEIGYICFPMSDVLVTSGEEVQGLNIVRSLGRQGVRVRRP